MFLVSKILRLGGGQKIRGLALRSKGTCAHIDVFSALGSQHQPGKLRIFDFDVKSNNLLPPNLSSTGIPDNSSDQSSLFGKTSEVEKLLLASYTDTNLEKMEEINPYMC